MKIFFFSIALLLASCDVWDLAPEIYVNYVVGDRDPNGRAMIARLFSGDGGYVTSSPIMPVGSIWQESRTIGSIDDRWYNHRRDNTVQVVWTISLVLPDGRGDSLVASRDMQLVHGRTAQIMWTGRLDIKSQNVPVTPNDTDTIKIDFADRSVIHNRLSEIFKHK